MNWRLLLQLSIAREDDASAVNVMSLASARNNTGPPYPNQTGGISTPAASKVPENAPRDIEHRRLRDTLPPRIFPRTAANMGNQPSAILDNIASGSNCMCANRGSSSGCSCAPSRG
jgi:hypothetical protein